MLSSRPSRLASRRRTNVSSLTFFTSLSRQPNLDAVPGRNRQQLLDLLLRRRQSGGRTFGERDTELEEHLLRPAGATEINILAGLLLSFLKECGVPTGMLANIPAVATTRSPLIVNVISPSRMKKPSSSRLWTCGGGPPPGGTMASNI